MFSVNLGDKCFTQLLGTSPESNGKSCFVTKECIQMMIRSHTMGYALTHQFLYFLIGVKNGLYYIHNCIYLFSYLFYLFI